MTILLLLIDFYFRNKDICIKFRHSRSIFNKQLNCYIMFSVFLLGLDMAKFTMNKKMAMFGPLKNGDGLLKKHKWLENIDLLFLNFLKHILV